MDYPSLADELEVVRRTTAEQQPAVDATLTPEQILDIQRLVRRVPVADHLIETAVRLVRATRPESPECPETLRPLLSRGGSPRASQALILAAKARAVVHGRESPTRADLHAVAVPVLAHRIALSYRAEAEGTTARQLVGRLVGELVPE